MNAGLPCSETFHPVNGFFPGMEPLVWFGHITEIVKQRTTPYDPSVVRNQTQLFITLIGLDPTTSKNKVP